MRERDPLNRLFARQDRHRLAAEFVRDNALAVSGLLVRDVGGPSVKPFQPPGYWSALNFPVREWQTDAGASVYRRGLYTHWQRTFPHPAMLAFDATSREECACERPRSNIPQQALVLLNDPEFVEAARAFAGSVLASGEATDRERIGRLFGGATGRPPTSDEATVLQNLLAKHRKDFEAYEAGAKKLIEVGTAPRPDGVPPAEAGGVDERGAGGPEPARNHDSAIMGPADNHRLATLRRSVLGVCKTLLRGVADRIRYRSCIMNDFLGHVRRLQRRAFLGQACRGTGALALASLFPAASSAASKGVVNPPHFPPKAKRVIFLVMAGGPSHLETFDYKPELARLHGKPMPESFTKGQPIAQLQDRQLNCFGPQWGFKKHGQSGRGDERAVRPPAEGGRRPVRRPVDADGGDQPRPGPHVHEHRFKRVRPAEHGVVAHLRPRQRGRRTCRGSWCSRRTAAAGRTSRSPRGSGRRASCRASSRGSTFAARATRCCTSTNPPGVGRDSSRT